MFGYRIEVVKENKNNSTTPLSRFVINKIFKMNDYDTREKAQQIVDLLYADGALSKTDFRYYTNRNRKTKTITRKIRW